MGRELGKGRKIRDVLGEMAMVAEGVDTALSVHQLCEREDLKLPIMTEVYNMLFQDKDPGEVVAGLLARTPYEEWKAFDLSSFQSK